MKKINVIKVGTVVNISIDGKLYKKVCSTDTEANAVFKQVLAVKENPTDEAMKQMRILLNEKTRTLYLIGLKELEADIENGEVYLAGFNTPIPSALVEIIKEYHENGFPLQPILNFWKLLMINPDTRVRTSLFNFISKHDFVLTDKGYMLVYKAVYRKEAEEEKAPETKHAEEFIEFISTKYLYVKSQWKCSPNKYVVYKTAEDKYEITKATTAETWDEKEKGVEILGKLGELYAALVTADNKKADKEQKPVKVMYTDMYSRTMNIELGVPAQKPRNECDGDPEVECSYGLHVGSTRYVENYASSKSIILACLVNPANVVAVPKYDHSKMRVTEYFPFAVANYDSTNKKIEIVERKYFEEDYATFEQKELEDMVAKVKANELPIQSALKAEKESRSMSELQKIIEQRILDLY